MIMPISMLRMIVLTSDHSILVFSNCIHFVDDDDLLSNCAYQLALHVILEQFCFYCVSWLDLEFFSSNCANILALNLFMFFLCSLHCFSAHFLDLFACEGRIL